MSTPTYVGRGSVATNNGTTVGYPAGLAADDLLILQTVRRNSSSFSTPAGWTALYNDLSPSGTNVRQQLFYKWATGTESGSITVGTIAVILAFRGVDKTSFHEGDAIVTGTGNPVSAPTIITGGVSRLAVCFMATVDNPGTINLTGETGGDWVESSRVENTSGSDMQADLHTADMSGGGTISGGSRNLSSFTFTWLARGFALVPAVVGGSGGGGSRSFAVIVG